MSPENDPQGDPTPGVDADAPSPLAARRATLAATTEAATQPKEDAADDNLLVEDMGEYCVGEWGDSGVPLYQCPYCHHAVASKRGDGTATIELHILGKIDSGDRRHMAALEIKK